MSEWDKLRAENTRLREALEASRMTHHVNVEDCWYTCPLAEGDERCCDDEARESGICNCGASEHNARIDAVLGVKHDTTQ